MTTVTKDLEGIARHIRKTRGQRKDKSRTLLILEQEISLASEQLDRARKIHKQQLDSIRRIEFYTERDLEQLKGYSMDARDRREKLKNKLLKLNRDRRRQIAEHEKDMATMHDRLCSLIAQRSHLRTEHGQNDNHTSS